MKYTIEGFSQEYALSLTKTVISGKKPKTIKLDPTDLVILRWFVDFYPNTTKMTVNGKEYAWLVYKKFLEDLPLVGIDRNGFGRRMRKLVDLGILDHRLLKENGSYSLYTFGEKYEGLVGGEGCFTNSTPCTTDDAPLASQIKHPVLHEQSNKDISIKNTSIKNKDIYSTSYEVLTPSEPEEEEKRPSPKEVVELFKSVCKSYPKPKSMSEARAKAIKARQKQYTDDEFREMFEKAEASAFLKGANDRNWSATFDWLMCDRNFGRVIDGNYDNGKVGYNPKKGAKETDDEWMQRMLREFADEDEKEEETEVLPY